MNNIIDEIAPSGRLRAAINFGNPVLAQRDPQTGLPRGISADLARELGRRLNIDIEFVLFDAAGKVVAGLHEFAWDVAFLAVDPERATEIAFSAPYVIIEGAYMVRKDSVLRTLGDVDHDDVRIAVAAGSAYDLYLSRTIRHAQIVRAPSGDEAIDRFHRENLEVAAGVRSPLLRYASGDGGLRVIQESFMQIEQAIAVPKTRARAARYVADVVEELKASGFVAEALQRSDQADAAVARPAHRALQSSP